MHEIPIATCTSIEAHFHALIRQRAAQLIESQQIALPRLLPTFDSDEGWHWFAVPGIYGGFRYQWQPDENGIKLMVESWSRVSDGSGQRHEVRIEGSRLIAEGFV